VGEAGAGGGVVSRTDVQEHTEKVRADSRVGLFGWLLAAQDGAQFRQVDSSQQGATPKVEPAHETGFQVIHFHAPKFSRLCPPAAWRPAELNHPRSE